MDCKKLLIRIATQEDYTALSDFRIRQFKDNKEFILKDSTLLSRQSGFIYIGETNCESGKQFIATMQIELIKSARDFNDEYSPFYNVELNSNHFPTLYISKVATEKSLRNIGLNSYLRLLVLEAAIRTPFINSLTGIIFKGSPRVNLMQKIGYEQKTMLVEKNAYLMPETESYFAWLEKSKFSFALKSLKEETDYLVNTYEITNDISSSLF